MLKKGIQGLFILLITACSAINYHDQTTITSTIDFRKYSDEGFLFTTGDYTYNYESIGIVDITMLPKVIDYDEDGEDGYLTAHAGSGVPKALYKPITMDMIFNTAFRKADSLGADGLIQIEITYPETIYNIEGKRITGLAIKRHNDKQIQDRNQSKNLP